MADLFQSTTIPLLEQVVQFTQARHQALAGNVANASTPGYVARDLSVDDFQGRLKEAIRERQAPTTAPTNDGLVLPTPDSRAGQEKLMTAAKSPKGILYHDQSQVGLEQQVSEMVKNRLDHNLAMTILTSQFRLLQTAISERV
jgi:flagellar basal-body rod protein FlgB